jgi:hypothetical protein
VLGKADRRFKKLGQEVGARTVNLAEATRVPGMVYPIHYDAMSDNGFRLAVDPSKRQTNSGDSVQRPEDQVRRVGPRWRPSVHALHDIAGLEVLAHARPRTA